MDADTTVMLTDPMDFKVKELLKEVHLDQTPVITKLVDDTVSSIKKSIRKIPDDLPVTADLAPTFVRDIGADKVDFKFKKPKSFKIGGSYSINCVVKPHVNVDLFVGLPKECFHEKDYLNYRYHAKRCLYLCVIKKHLKSSASFDKVEWSFMQNEARKPVLVAYPAVKQIEAPNFFVRIIPTATSSLFSISKLNLKRNNVRAFSQDGVPQATPKYNSSVLEDMFLEDNAEYVKKTICSWKELGEALILLKVWARQRSSIYVHDCLNGYLISILLSYLVSSNKISKAMKAVQIVRVALDFIATSKLWNRGLYFPPEGEKGASKEEKAQCKESFPVIIFDPSTQVNLAFRMTSVAFFELQDEAASTLRCMEKCRDGGFEDIFLTKIDYPAKYDYYVRLNLRGHAEVHALGFCLDDECWRLYEQKLHSVLNQGLGDRAKFIRVTWRNTPLEWSIENGLSVLDREPLLVGISLSSMEKVYRVVDIGPNAESKEEALKFRKFWGEKAELRRFKDGTIAESTVWESEQWSRHLILKKIVEYVLLRHFSLLKENIVQIVDQLDFSLLHGVKDPVSFSASLLEAFEVLSKRLRLIEDIPLKISSVQPLDSAFRFTSVFPPEPHPLAGEKHCSRLDKLTPSCIPPLDVMIQLEGSGNWPMDHVAIEKTKSAFLIQIGESLQNRWGMTCTAMEDDVDVFMSGYAFRLKILHERGLNLVKRENGNQAKQIYSTDKMLFISGQHASMINGLQGRYPVFGPVVRLAKRWVASHLFSACLVEEAVELLIAYLFLKPLPFSVPCSRVTGFLRFLRLLAEFDWTFSALVVDINNDFGPDDHKEINDNFMSIRKASEENMQNISPAMFLATAYDKASEAWTRCSPTLMELKRLVAYAQSSANLLTKLVLEDQTDSYRWECLFRTPLNNYGAVVLLHRDRLPYPHRLLFPSEVNKGRHVAHGKASKAFHPFLLPGDMKGSSEEVKNKLMVDFDPLRCFVQDLEKEYSMKLKLWYDSLGGDAVGLTWEKVCSKKRGRDEASEEEKDPIDVLKALGELGKGFVRDVYFLKAPRLMN